MLVPLALAVSRSLTLRYQRARTCTTRPNILAGGGTPGEPNLRGCDACGTGEPLKMLRFLMTGGDTTLSTGARGTVQCEADTPCFMKAEVEGPGCPRYFATAATKPDEDGVSRKYTVTEEFKSYTDESCEPFAAEFQCWDTITLAPLVVKALTYRDFVGSGRNVTNPTDTYASTEEQPFSSSDNCGTVRTSDCWPNGNTNPGGNTGWLDGDDAREIQGLEQFSSTPCGGVGRTDDNSVELEHVIHDSLIIVHNSGAALPSHISCGAEGPRELCFGPPTGLYADSDYFEQCGTQEIGPPGYRTCNGWHDATCKLDYNFQDWLPDPHIYSGGLCKQPRPTSSLESGLTQPNAMLSISDDIGNVIGNISLADATLGGSRYNDLKGWGVFGDETFDIDGSYNPHFKQTVTIDIGCGASGLNIGDQFGMLRVDGFLTMQETNELQCGTCEGSDPTINSVCVGPNPLAQPYNEKQNICDAELPIFQQAECTVETLNENSTCKVCGSEIDPEPECEICYPNGPNSAKVTPSSLTFRLVGGASDYLSNMQGGKASVYGSDMFAGSISSAWCRLADFEVNGDTLTVSSWSGTDVACTVSGPGGSQTFSVHASCSQPFYLDDQVGAMQLVDFRAEYGYGSSLSAANCQAGGGEPPETESCDVCHPDIDDGEGTDLCTMNKVKPSSLTFRLVGGAISEISNRQDGKALVIGTTLQAGTIEQASCASGTYRITVDEITVTGWTGADVVCTLMGPGGYQTIRVHASCSKPLAINDRFGAFRLIDQTSPASTGFSRYREKGMGMGKHASVVHPSSSKVKPGYIQFQLVGGSATDITDDQQGKASVVGNPISAGNIVAASCVSGFAYLEDDTITISGWKGADIQCSIVGPDGTQHFTVHASCSKPLLIGYQFGAVQLVAFGQIGSLPQYTCSTGGVFTTSSPKANKDTVGRDRITQLVFRWQGVGVKDLGGNLSITKSTFDIEGVFSDQFVTVTPTTFNGWFKAATTFCVFSDCITLHTSCSLPVFVGQELRFTDGTLTLTGFSTLSGRTIESCEDNIDLPNPPNQEPCMCLGQNIPICLMHGRNGTRLNAALNDNRQTDGVPPKCCNHYWYSCAVAVGVGLNSIKPTTGRPVPYNDGYGSLDGSEGYTTVNASMINMGIQIDLPGCSFNDFGKAVGEGIPVSCYVEWARDKHVGAEGYGTFPGALGGDDDYTLSSGLTILLSLLVTLCVLLSAGCLARKVHLSRTQGKIVLSGLVARHGTDISDDFPLEIEPDARFASPVVPLACGKDAGSSFSVLAVRVSDPARGGQESLLF